MCYAGHGGMSRTHVRSLFGEKSENCISLSPLNKTGYLLFGSVLSEITYADLSAFRRGCIKALHPPPNHSFKQFQITSKPANLLGSRVFLCLMVCHLIVHSSDKMSVFFRTQRLQKAIPDY